ncbi:HAD family hydrolase [Demequina sp. TTPB684]|uniref:HAD family hydrolase n=1 Tax=unclassified Demequina TaxID=2620311 RepID=UPI001CF1D184|nr:MULTISPECIES: HAD family hydrolase [unclassified Demequina]MCB2413691.1 HAD family hydrolase [Demequina sp. TTPB684]UPU87753.1 HAD family hydrolase [Demequina sp. TMPB413]
MAVAPEDLDPPLTPDHWRLVGLDIDGTLMHWGGDISDSVIEAVGRVRMSRNHVVLATGRNIIATMPVAERLGISRGWAVCSNGAVTIRLNPRSPGGYDIAKTITFNPRAALELIKEEMPDAFFAVEDLGVGFRVTKEFPMGELVGPQRVVTFDELCHDDVTRVVIRAPGANVDHFDQIVHRIGLSDVTYAVGYSAWLDLTPPGVSKASALEALREQLGVHPEHTVAVGDGNNDIDMLTWARDSYAMGNAPERVIAAAKGEVGPVDEDGVLEALEPLIDPARLAM